MLQQSKWKITLMIRNSNYTLQSDVWLNANEPYFAKCLLKCLDMSTLKKFLRWL